MKEANKTILKICMQNMNYVHVYCDRIRIPSNCVKLIFGMVHPSTFEHLETQFGFVSWSNVLTLGIFFSFKYSKVKGCTIPKMCTMHLITLIYMFTQEILSYLTLQKSLGPVFKIPITLCYCRLFYGGGARSILASPYPLHVSPAHV